VLPYELTATEAEAARVANGPHEGLSEARGATLQGMRGVGSRPKVEGASEQLDAPDERRGSTTDAARR
jgi:hypothetical protein